MATRFENGGTMLEIYVHLFTSDLTATMGSPEWTQTILQNVKGGNHLTIFISHVMGFLSTNYSVSQLTIVSYGQT